MGIDRIGKGGAAPPPDLDKVGKTGAVETPFAVDRADRVKEAAPVDASQGTSPLAQLKAGTIDVERYLDLKVDEATKTLDGLPAAQLDEIKQALREKIATDPLLVDLVKSATGKVPNPPENE
jgi:hypothetical protein